jgi:purine-nucleoside phosphorylase
MDRDQIPPIVAPKPYQDPSVFLPENLLREARRQKGISRCEVPPRVVLDPDGDLTDFLIKRGRAERNECWACYHSKLYSTTMAGAPVGIIPRVVGAPYAVLVAEQLFVSGCKLLLSVTSAGVIDERRISKRFALITNAVRDEGTSYHYIAPEQAADLSPTLYERLAAVDEPGWFCAKSWTTDAPYRETAAAIEAMRDVGVACVEMEAAALYAFAMAQHEGDFEKGEDAGSAETMRLLEDVVTLLTKTGGSGPYQRS